MGISGKGISLVGQNISNREVINSISDFPSAVGGVISLSDSTEYYIGNAVDIGENVFSVGNNVLISGATGISQLISSNTSSLFVGQDVGFFTIKDVVINSPASELFDLIDSVQGVSILFLSNVVVLECETLGKIEDIGAINFSNSAFRNTNNGLALFGENNIVSLREVSIFTTSTTFVGLDLGISTTSTLELSNYLAIGPPGGFGVSGLTGSSNINPGFIGSVRSCEFIGGLTPLNGITSDDVGYNFSGNSGIENTMPSGFETLNSNATETIISAVNTPVKVAGTWTEEDASHFTTDATGTITYIGRIPITVGIDAVLSSTITGGGNDNTTFYIAINGIVVTNSGVGATHNQNTVTHTSIVWEVTVSNTDTIELWAENNDDVSNIIVGQSTFRVK